MYFFYISVHIDVGYVPYSQHSVQKLISFLVKIFSDIKYKKQTFYKKEKQEESADGNTASAMVIISHVADTDVFI